MTETVLHRNDWHPDAAGIHVWGWEIPVYLFLGGLVAGLLVLGGHHMLRARREPELRSAWPRAPMLGVVLLSLGMGALFLDLGNRWNAWRMYLSFEITSPMSWGAWILVLVYPALLAAALPRFREHPRFGRIVGFANIAGGIALGLYTGVLLGTLGARPLWNSAILGPLFLFSGLSTAAALMHLLGAGRTMLRADTVFVTIEVVLLSLWLVGLGTATAVHREAADLLLAGPYAPAFWALVVVTGLLAPLALQLAELAGRIRHTLAPAVMVLAGGFALRWILVSAGQASHW